MITVEFFEYSEPQWASIKGVVFNRLGRDADHTESQYEYREVVLKQYFYTSKMGSLRYCLETAAYSHILRSARESQTPAHKAGIKQLVALRNEAKALPVKFKNALAPFVTAEGARIRSMVPLVDQVNKAERAIVTLVSVLDASIAAQRPQPTANSSKSGRRDRFLNEALAIWTSIGGLETGKAAAEFLIAVSDPVFDRVRDIDRRKTMASMPQHPTSVVEWLRLRAKAQRRSAVRRPVS